MNSFSRINFFYLQLIYRAYVDHDGLGFDPTYASSQNPHRVVSFNFFLHVVLFVPLGRRPQNQGIYCLGALQIATSKTLNFFLCVVLFVLWLLPLQCHPHPVIPLRIFLFLFFPSCLPLCVASSTTPIRVSIWSGSFRVRLR